MKFNLFSKSYSYLNWDEYRARILAFDTLMFIDRAARESIRNFWKKQSRGDSNDD